MKRATVIAFATLLNISAGAQSPFIRAHLEPAKGILVLKSLDDLVAMPRALFEQGQDDQLQFA